MSIIMTYDEFSDEITISANQSEPGECYANIHISFDRGEFLQRLMELSSTWGEDFDIFDGMFPGETNYEPTELTFLQPPTRDCIDDDEEES